VKVLPLMVVLSGVILNSDQDIDKDESYSYTLNLEEMLPFE